MRFDVLTIFPESIEPYLRSSILGRAEQDNRIQTKVWNLRDFTTDKHKTVDDTPYGGGAGMVMKVEPIDRALAAITQEGGGKRRVIVLSARGNQFTQAQAEAYAQLDQLILICGRYEGIDQRVADHLADEEISIGPYVLAGGELPALTVLESTARLIPGVLGNPDSLTEESFSTSDQLSTNNSTVEYPQYSKPEVYRDWAVPPVLLSGNHAAIKKWRSEQSS